MFKKSVVVILFSALLVTAALPAHAGFDEGKAAYNAQNWKEAILNLRPLAETGDDRAMLLLGNMYLEGYGVDKDPREAFALYREAAIRNNVDAMVATATLYQGGIGIPLNTRLAIDWFQRAAQLGSPTGAFFYAIHLYQGAKGESFDVKPDHPAAYKWFRIASLRGNQKLKAVADGAAQNLAKKITPEQVAAADKEALAFQPAEAASLGPAPDVPPAATADTKEAGQPTGQAADQSTDNKPAGSDTAATKSTTKAPIKPATKAAGSKPADKKTGP